MGSHRPSPLFVSFALLVTGCARPPSDAADAADAPDAPDASEAPEPMNPTTCGDCHVREAQEWSASAHHVAFTNPVFRAEYELSEQAACVRCHAPAADADAPAGDAAAAGIDCATCHVRGAAIVAVRATGRAPHAVTADAAFGTVAACAHCHDFPFATGGRGGYEPSAPLQHTVHEWAEQPGTASCQSCHMPHGSHAFLGPRDGDLLARSLAVTTSATRTGRGTHVTVTLRNVGAGHAVPTGDVFRRLVVRAWIAGSPRSERRAVLMRRFALRGGRRREIADDRVPAGGARTVELDVPHGAHVAWRVEWWALDERLAPDRWLEDDDIRRTVAAGITEVTR